MYVCVPLLVLMLVLGVLGEVCCILCTECLCVHVCVRVCAHVCAYAFVYFLFFICTGAGRFNGGVVVRVVVVALILYHTIWYSGSCCG